MAKPHKTLLGADEVKTLLRALVTDCGTQTKAAVRLGVSKAFLSDVLLHRRALGTTIAAYFGYVPVTMYQAQQEEG